MVRRTEPERAMGACTLHQYPPTSSAASTACSPQLQIIYQALVVHDAAYTLPNMPRPGLGHGPGACTPSRAAAA
jgi:hypothetical protein